ncbi:SURF1 family protein [Sphingomonas sp. ID1715]|uniref:SURF1 family cytochrome oxidase biogenesis protein n=1 Tax=Sphingomonas sp. ID1715 TaxID=1656898 RepID=UPI00148896B8|nr:SURF1 family cytochrome oxidase biogenesis protein [Sphingomonas sp. ID1715]NNM77091.1 SURF1 family protein [Sphingomonas sp. ID1715]
MIRLPLIPTLIVAAAVAVMIWLGLWQLDRRAQKEAALARYAAAQGQAPIPWPEQVDPRDPPLFRRSGLDCHAVAGWREESGRNLRGEAGWVHIAECRTVEGSANVVVGWSSRPDRPNWRGGQVAGVIGPDRSRTIRLIAGQAPAGLLPARPPSLEDVPNNHLSYAIQWFFFAFTALVIYFLALRRRAR